MSPLPNKAYGPGAKLDYNDPAADIRVVWKASTWAQMHHCSVRGITVEKVGQTVVDKRRICYVECRFPDGRIMVVNEGNIRIKKVSKHHVHSIS